MNKFYQTHMHTHTDYFSKHTPSLLKQLSHQETSESKPLVKKSKSIVQIHHPAAPLLLLWNCCPAKHFEAQKDGNPKALHHDCGGRWKSKSAASQL